jgi:acyl-CoA hydrolase
MIQHLAHQPPPDVAIAQLTPPDQDGWCAPGLSCDFLPLVWSRAHHRVAHINPRLPRLRSSFRVHLSELSAWVESDDDLLDFKEPAAGALEHAVGRWAAELIRDGDTLQFGIGAVPLGLAHHLRHHRGLRFHGGLVASALQTLQDAGALDPDAPVVTGVVLGNEALREYVRHLDTLWLTDIRHTHAQAARDPSRRFVAINSALEVDLFGQVNAERMGGVQQAGAGGMPAFASAALNNPGGRLMICLPATARQGAVSRIVPALGPGSACTLPAYQADVVITEHGAAQIRHLPPDARARALIAIAAPEHRDALQAAWHAQRPTS